DGNVILQAEGTQFKVHRGILAESSSVFKDMFGFPQPPEAYTEVVEGCPVVRVSDSAQDMKIVLQAIFQMKYVTGGDGLSLTVLSAFVTLGGKYDIRRLHMEGKRKLYQEFPTVLQEMDLIKSWSFVQTDKDHSTWIHLAQLARKERLLLILPYLLYRCIFYYSAMELLGGILNEDGSRSRLAAEDQLVCLAAHRPVFLAQAGTTFEWIYDLDTLSSKCINPATCDNFRLRLLVSFLPVPSVAGLTSWHADIYTEDLCTHCAEVAERRHEEGRQKFWEELPGLFGLPPWSELKEEEPLYVCLIRCPLLSNVSFSAIKILERRGDSGCASVCTQIHRPTAHGTLCHVVL
ncbi:hypothetical protein FIBSPDRAFT_753926, partial [Athelia psychrophila]